MNTARREGLRQAAPAGRAGVALAQTPSLVELAQKEQERRKGLKSGTAAKVYSDKDLPKTGTPAVASSVPAATPTVVPDQKPPEAKPPEKNEEAAWRNRMAQAREAQRRAEMFAEALQSRINALTTDVVNRDDPYQRAKLADDRKKALAELQRAFRRIRQAAGFQQRGGRIDADAKWAVLADLLLQAVGKRRHGRHCKASYGA